MKYLDENSIKISLIIPAYNEEDYIGDCLDHVIKVAKGRFFEIIVVDNASIDSTGKIAEQYPGVRVVYEEVKGLTRARQRGFEESTGDVLAYVDADTRIPEGWYDRLMHEFRRNSTVSCVSGPYIFYDVSLMHKLITKIYWYFALPIYWITGYMATGGNFAIKRSVLEQMNGFDTTIVFYGEDTNLARRARRFGKVRFNPNHYVYTSARRLHAQGWVRTGIIYLKNFFSEVLLQRPATKTYDDIR